MMDKEYGKLALNISVGLIALGMGLSLVPTKDYRANYLAVAILGGSIGAYTADSIYMSGRKRYYKSKRYSVDIISGIAVASVAMAIWSIRQKSILQAQ